jgi:inner membrane transporter RhtA
MNKRSDLPLQSAKLLNTANTQPPGIFNKMPAQLFGLLSMTSIQIGASVSESLFQAIGPLGTTFFRLSFSAIVYLLLWRPRFTGHSQRHIWLAILFGVNIAIMNATFYSAIQRIPLGIAVTLEFVGPLGVAIIQSRRLKDLIWVILAAIGIILLAPLGNNNHIDLLGVGLALLAGVFWGCYILLNVQVGRAFSGGTGLALSMIVAALFISPFGIFTGGAKLLVPHTILLGFAVAMLSTALPFALELEGLRRMTSRAWGIFMSLEPAIAVIVGYIILKQVISLRELIAVAFVIIASIGVSLEGNAHAQ